MDDTSEDWAALRAVWAVRPSRGGGARKGRKHSPATPTTECPACGSIASRYGDPEGPAADRKWICRSDACKKLGSWRLVEGRVVAQLRGARTCVEIGCGLPTGGNSALCPTHRVSRRSRADHRLRSVEQAAEQLAISERQVRRLIAAGSLRSVLIGRRRLVPAVAIEDYVAGLLKERTTS